MHRFLRRFLAPLSALAVAVVMLVVTFRSTNVGITPLETEVDRQADARAELLSKLTSMELEMPAREFVLLAAKEIRDPERLDAEQWTRASDSFYQSGYWGLAEQCLRNAVSTGSAPEARIPRLARLLYISGRLDECRHLLIRTLQVSELDNQNLAMLGSTGLTWQEDVEAISRIQIDETTALLAKAWIAIQNQQLESAMSMLSHCDSTTERMQVTRLIQLRSLCLSRLGRSAELARLFSEQSESTLNSSTELLCIQGELCRSLNKTDASVRCYWEAFQKSPNHYAANAQLAELLEIAQLPELAAIFRERSSLVRDYEDSCRQIHSTEVPSEQQIGFAAYTARNLHCFREALNWASLAKQGHPDAAWPADLIAECRAKIQRTDERHSSLKEWIEFQSTTLDRYPRPDWRTLSSEILSPEDTKLSEIVFDDETEDCGIQFQFEDAADVKSSETRLFEFTGGGVSVTDLDHDGWPDLFFTQGGDPPLLGNPDQSNRIEQQAPPNNPQKTDQLYRNRSGRHFENVTGSAGLTDGGYSQGCASGDIDNDGFSDLLIANIGQNQLLRNNGDGTFSETPLPESDRWTTSCGIADVTGDGNPDIYEVNHVVSSGVHQKMCQRDGVSTPCQGVSALQAEQDRLFAGDGSGRFEDITETSGIVAADGLGLGLCIFRLDEKQQLSMFVANDARANFLFVNQGEECSPQFREEALTRGIALSGTGRAQACMGIAAGDVDRNSTVDFVVTNFFADYNTLYLQRPTGFFQDESASSNLIESSFYKLGFGSQLMDADLDGDLDLVVTNGDVADFSKENPDRPYQQRPQLLQNNGSGTFFEQKSELSGSAFRTERLGRGLARLDWNADGRPDFAVSHIGTPAMLATNRTHTNSQSLSIQLVGTTSPRTPIGAIVRLTSPKTNMTIQLMAGDGYQCSNEAKIHLGLGTDRLPVQGTVTWPSGNTQEFTADHDQVILVEGRPMATFELRN